MKRVRTRMALLTLLAACAVALVVVPAAPATIHPIMLGWVCGNASGDPPGQTPSDETTVPHSDQSTLQALTATGVLTDLSLPPSKFSTFDPVTETGTPDSPGAVNCANSPF
jgi:hypothetical protein